MLVPLNRINRSAAGNFLYQLGETKIPAGICLPVLYTADCSNFSRHCLFINKKALSLLTRPVE
jgi:hypothetical protein